MAVFNIRVYGILINEKKDVLVTDEFRFGQQMTKFPGGGLNWGEGTIDCLKREFREELGCEIEVIRHFYTTDFFQPSAFHTDHQLISIYYLVKNIGLIEKKISRKKTELGKTEGAQTFRWIPVAQLISEEFTFPIDKKVVLMLSPVA